MRLPYYACRNINPSTWLIYFTLNIYVQAR